MPFLTYKIKNEIFENYRNFDIKNFEKFLYDIEDLNYSKKAILVDNDISILEKIQNTQKLISNNVITDNFVQTLNALLVEAYRVLNLSNKVLESDKIKIDFIKNRDNGIERNHKKKLIKGQYNSQDFEGSSKKLREDFLDKIKLYIESQNKEIKKINEIYIFHKELSKMLIPIVKNKKRVVFQSDSEGKEFKLIKDQGNLNQHFQEYLNIKDLAFKENIKGIYNYKKNLKIIQNSINLILNWWLSFNEKYIPSKIFLISDMPDSLLGESSENLIKAENLINNFLFKNIFQSNITKIQPSFKFLNRDEFKQIPELRESNEIWTHKRHFVFGINQNFVFSSHFGVEIISDTNPKKIRQKTILEVEDDEKDMHLFHLKYLIPYLNNKTQESMEIQELLHQEELIQWEAYNK
tara:strand:- start:1102 stop:2325 length:1224 start_codon:yes stop_codon:yes gene_type:complete